MNIKVIALLLSFLLILGFFAGCSAEEKSAEKTELIVFAAASMTETLTELGEKYMSEKDVKLIFTFDSSGTLKRQIEEGAECDIFISAGQKQMDELEPDHLLSGSRFDLLENKVALVVPEGNPKKIGSYDELKGALTEGDIVLAIGNADVPVGQYTQKILASFGLEEETLANAGCLTYGTNVKDVTAKVSEGAVDCGIVYQTDAFSAGLAVIDTASAEMCGQVIYPAAVVKSSEQKEAAEAFLAYLIGDDADAVFQSVGFTPASK